MKCVYIVDEKILNSERKGLFKIPVIRGDEKLRGRTYKEQARGSGIYLGKNEGITV